MTHPALATMVEAAKAVGPQEWRLAGKGTIRIGNAEWVGTINWRRRDEKAAHIVATQPANILSLDEYVRGLEEKAAALLEEVTYLSGKYPLEPSLSGLEVAASDLRVALGGKP